MRILIISDTHFGHINLSKKYQERPPDFEEKISRNWNRMATPDDMIIHLGDVFVGNPKSWQTIVSKLKGRKILVKVIMMKRVTTGTSQTGFHLYVTPLSG